MAGLDLHPLSIGEILDRTFTLYRRYFLLFVGIFAIPQMLVLALQLAQVIYMPIYSSFTTAIWMGLAILAVRLFAYLISQGGTVLAVSELYLGRPTSIGESLRRVWEEIGSVFGVVALNSIVILLGFVALILPGIYLMCRLLVCVPVALIEKRGARESLERSFGLTRDNTVRSFIILLLPLVLSWAAQMLLSAPFTVAIVLARGDASMLRFWMAMSQVGSSVASILVGPILLIATSIYYYDLRVRKEAFDLQLMLDPNAQQAPGTGGIPSILS